MAEIFLSPNEFQGQIDEFESGAGAIKEIAYVLDKQNLELQSIERFAECVALFNETIQLMGQLQDLDTLSMKRVKATWMKDDNDIATKTFMQSIRE